MHLLNQQELTMKGIIFTWYDCNESCFFCSAEVHGRKDVNRSLKEILEDIHRYSLEWYTEIEFIGWEVLIRPDVLLIIAFAKKKWFSTISLETNGTRFADKDFCRQVLHAGLNKITLSIHGATANICDKHTGLVWSYDKKILWLQNLQDLHGEYNFSIATNYVVTSKNLSEIPDFVRLMDSFPMLEHYIFAFVRPLQSYNKMYKHYLPSFTDIRSVFQSFPIHPKVSIQYLPLCVLDPAHQKQYQSLFLKWEKSTTEKSNAENSTIILEDAIQHEMAYLPGCSKCELKASCRWVWKEYVDFFAIQQLPLV